MITRLGGDKKTGFTAMLANQIFVLFEELDTALETADAVPDMISLDEQARMIVLQNRVGAFQNLNLSSFSIHFDYVNARDVFLARPLVKRKDGHFLEERELPSEATDRFK